MRFKATTFLVELSTTGFNDDVIPSILLPLFRRKNALTPHVTKVYIPDLFHILSLPWGSMTLNDFAKRHQIKLTDVVRMSGFGRSTLFSWWASPDTRTRAIVIVLGCAEARKYTRILHDPDTRDLIATLDVERNNCDT